MDSGETFFADLAIQLEMSIGELYLLFSQQIQEDTDFWWQLAIEEKNHAALIRSAVQLSDSSPLDFSDLLLSTQTLLEHDLQRINELIEQYTGHPADRLEALDIAMELEQSAGEAHYQDIMTTDSDSSLIRILKRLNRADIDHYKRISERRSDL